MTLIRLEHVPRTVKVNLPLYIILPDTSKIGAQPIAKRRVLTLLHGLSDDGSAWQRYTSIETLASAYGLVVVMPSVGRSFYTDQPNGQAYFSYLVDEVPELLKVYFGLRPRREDNLIAGNSMGGYGAMKAALKRPGQYAAAASFSGALSLAVMNAVPDDPRRAEFELLFGKLDVLAGSKHDPLTWLQAASRKAASVPRLWISCGRQDDLYPLSLMFRQACEQAGVKVEYHEQDARHDWFFWDEQIRLFLADVLGALPEK